MKKLLYCNGLCFDHSILWIRRIKETISGRYFETQWKIIIKVKLMTVDPGHFHAALVQKIMYPQVSPDVHVYAPEGPDVSSISTGLHHITHGLLILPHGMK